MKKKIALSLCILLLLTGCGRIPTLQNGEEIVAQISGKDFTAEELYAVLKEKAGNQLLTTMIDEYIARLEIEDDTDAKVAAKNDVEYTKQQFKDNDRDFNQALKDYGYANEQALIDEYTVGYLKEEAVKKFLSEELTKKEINDYYDKDVFGEMTVRHILIKPVLPEGKTEADATEEEIKKAEAEALAKAKDIIKKINDGQKFEDAAKEFSDDSSAKDGGLISNFTKDGVVTEFWNASMKLKNGEMTNAPVKTEFGYHIILRVSQKKKPALDDVIEQVKETLVNEKLNESENAYNLAWVELRKKHKLNIIDSELEKQYNTTADALKKAQ